MRALRLIVVLAVLISTMAKPKTYISEGDRDEQRSTISDILQYLRHQYDTVNSKISPIITIIINL